MQLSALVFLVVGFAAPMASAPDCEPGYRGYRTAAAAVNMAAMAGWGSGREQCRFRYCAARHGASSDLAIHPSAMQPVAPEPGQPVPGWQVAQVPNPGQSIDPTGVLTSPMRSQTPLDNYMGDWFGKWGVMHTQPPPKPGPGTRVEQGGVRAGPHGSGTEILPDGTVVLDGGATEAAEPNDAACSASARMVLDSVGMTITIGTRSERWVDYGSWGTDLNGRIYAPEDGGKPENLFHTTIILNSGQHYHDEPEILIFQDRVWWPCSHPLAQEESTLGRSMPPPTSAVNADEAQVHAHRRGIAPDAAKPIEMEPVTIGEQPIVTVLNAMNAAAADR